jgi:hypothetical protein
LGASNSDILLTAVSWIISSIAVPNPGMNLSGFFFSQLLVVVETGVITELWCDGDTESTSSDVRFGASLLRGGLIGISKLGSDGDNKGDGLLSSKELVMLNFLSGEDFDLS